MTTSIADEAAPRAEDGNPSEIGVYGDFPERVVTIDTSLVTLRMAVGFPNGSGPPVLAPYAEFHLEVSANNAAATDRTVFSHLLTLENVAFLISDMARDFAEATEHLVEMSRGNLKPRQDRIDAMLTYLEAAMQGVQASTDMLKSLTLTGEDLL